MCSPCEGPGKYGKRKRTTVFLANILKLIFNYANDIKLSRYTVTPCSTLVPLLEVIIAIRHVSSGALLPLICLRCT